MRLELGTEQAEALQVLLDATLRELSYEIASADVPSYRQHLRDHREILRTILEQVGGAIPASERLSR